ncbi:MAG: hypothetical protein C0475_00385 [Planctomyces sp.]|nr:hypothetical protein [Planctomyces sp.]MBA4119179.1 hypothetical protein [Isosphaera sp.]
MRQGLSGVVIGALVAGAGVMGGHAGSALGAPVVPAGAAAPAAGQDQAPSPLKIGDPAPALSVDAFVKGAPVGSYEAGKVYVVEFWATWCGPCLTSIPHLTELAKSYKDKGVSVVGISSADRSKAEVEAFVARMGDQMNYTVAYEGDNQMSRAFMEAAGQGGIPTAFIVDQKGRVAWIGHPLADMDATLARVVAGNYDPVAEAAKAGKIETLTQEAFSLADQAAWDQALDKVDQILALDAGRLETVMLRWGLLLQGKRDFAAANAYARQIAAGVLAGNGQALSAVAWNLLEVPKESRDLDLALQIAEQSVRVTGSQDADTIDTLARVHFERGELDKAVERQTKAVELAKGTPQAADYQARLDQYTAAKK